MQRVGSAGDKKALLNLSSMIEAPTISGILAQGNRLAQGFWITILEYFVHLLRSYGMMACRCLAVPRGMFQRIEL